MSSSDALLQRRRRFAMVLLVVLAFVGFSLASIFSQPRQTAESEEATLSSQDETVQMALAVAALEELKVKDRMPRDGYTRSQFGSGWATVGGCDMRNRILQRDLQNTAVDSSNNCMVLSGTLENDPYTGTTINFIRGTNTSSAVQIDHVVALSDAWQKGAQNLALERRREFANDPLNLLAVDGPANQQKGNKDAANWLPHKPYRCRYVARQIAVKVKYLIWVTESEFNAMKRVLNSCRDQKLPLESLPNSG